MPKNGIPNFSGDLKQPIIKMLVFPFGVVPGETQRERSAALKRRIGQIRLDKLFLLLKYYKIRPLDSDRWPKLALCLACDFVPGMKVMDRFPRRSGRPKETWTLEVAAQLLEDVDKIMRQQLASAAVEQGISPLEVMLKRMRYYDSVVDRELEKGETADRGIIDHASKAANDAAKDAAPYLHPRLSAVEHTGDPDGGLAEILKLCQSSTRGLPDPARIPPDRPPKEAAAPPSPLPAPPPVEPPPSRLETPSWSKSLLPEPPSYDWVGQRRR